MRNHQRRNAPEQAELLRQFSVITGWAYRTPRLPPPVFAKIFILRWQHETHPHRDRPPIFMPPNTEPLKTTRRVPPPLPRAELFQGAPSHSRFVWPSESQP